MAGQAADACGGKHERDGEDSRQEGNEAAEESDDEHEAHRRWRPNGPDRCMTCHSAYEMFMPSAAAVGHAIFPSLFTSHVDISSSGSTISGRFSWMKASA